MCIAIFIDVIEDNNEYEKVVYRGLKVAGDMDL
jgi:hypothetical protein